MITEITKATKRLYVIRYQENGETKQDVYFDKGFAIFETKRMRESGIDASLFRIWGNDVSVIIAGRE